MKETDKKEAAKRRIGILKRICLMAAVILTSAICVFAVAPQETQAASKPAKVTGVTAKSASYNSIKVSWSKASGATKYVVYRSTSKNGTYKRVKVTKSTSWTDTGRTTGKTYYYKVRAYNGKYGSYSAVKSAKPKPNKVSGVSVTNRTAKATLSWNAVSGVNRYQIYRSTSKNGTYTKVKTTSSTRWTDTTIDHTQVYYYKVRAYKTVNGTNVYGTFSSVVGFRSVYNSTVRFFTWMSTNDDLTEDQQAEAATAVTILKGTYTGSTNSYNATYDDLLDCVTLGTGTTSLSNLKTAITMIKKGNSYRTSDDNFTGLSSLKISPILMAVSELQTAYATTTVAHAQTFSVGENLAWGYSNPYAGWYTAEKATYDSGDTSYSSCGHYLNLVDSDYVVTGFALSGTVMGQSFCWSSSTYGTAANAYSYSEFLSLYNEYMDYVEGL